MSTKYAVQPTPISLFSSSLEAHMTAYTEEIKLNQLNQEYQLAQNRIIREAELYNLSQADLMNRLNALKEQLQTDIKATTIPLSKTNAPEVKVEEERYIPMTAYEYENKINSKKNKQPTFSEELLKNQGKDKKGIKITLPDILDKKSNLKKATPNAPKTKSKSPFQQELEEKLNIKNKGIIKEKTPSISDSNSATTASNSAVVGIITAPKFPQVKKQMKETLTESEYKQALNEMEKLPSTEKIAYMNKKISGGGFLKKKAKKNK